MNQDKATLVYMNQDKAMVLTNGALILCSHVFPGKKKPSRCACDFDKNIELQCI